MMNEIYYEKLNDLCRCEDSFTEEQRGEVLNAAKTMVHLSNTARREGLLSLEEEAKALDLETGKEFVKELIELFVSGTEPKMIEDYGLSRFLATAMPEHEALICLIAIKGAILIQAGTNPYVFENLISAMLPKEIRADYIRQKKAEAEAERLTEAEEVSKRIDDLCNQNRIGDEKDYSLASEVGHVIESMNDKDIQRLLRDIENSKLMVALKVLGRGATRRIFDNISEKLSKMLLDSMDCMGPWRMKDVDDTLEMIAELIIIRTSEYEISPGVDLSVLKIMLKIRESDNMVHKEYKDEYRNLKLLLEDIWRR